MSDPMYVVEWVEPLTCGAARGPRSRTRCELPPDHVTGRASGNPTLELYHLGRSPAGRWFSWPGWEVPS